MRYGLDFLSFFLILAALVLALGRWHESRSVFAPEAEHEMSPVDVGLEAEDVLIESRQREIKIHGWFFRGRDDGPVILYVHGNAGNISGRLPVVRGYVENGLGVFIYDPRGYGKSGGKPDRKSFVDDAFTAYSYLTENRGVKGGNVIILGQSLGGVPALRLANSVKCGGVILEGTFYSVRQMAKDIYPSLPIWLMASSEYDNSREIVKLNVPLLMIHGTKDEVVPHHHSVMLYEMAPEPKEFISVEGSSHTGMFEAAPELYYGAIKRFAAMPGKTGAAL